MAPKRKATSKAAPPKKAKVETSPAVEPPATSSKAKGSSGLSVADVWSSKEYVDKGAMSQEGFAKLCEALGLEEMSFESVYLMYTLSPEVDDVMVVCPSKAAFQRGVECLGCKSVAEVAAKLRLKRAALQADFGPRFRPFFAWLFEMGRQITAANTGACPTVVRSVPLEAGLPLLSSALGPWSLLPQFCDFSQNVFAQPFNKDLWMQLGRFVEMTTSGQIHADLSNYDDDLTGGGNAWPCMIDDFVEFVQKGHE